MKLTALSLIGQYGYFKCSVCGLKLFKIIFRNEMKIDLFNPYIWYCSNCLIKELNKPKKNKR